MSAFRISDVTTFFMVIAAALAFVAMWIITSERRRNLLKTEVKKLKTQAGSCEREKFILLEKINILENAQGSAEQGGWAGNAADLERQLQEARERASVLQVENNGLNKELADARSSLEEVYKALS